MPDALRFFGVDSPATVRTIRARIAKLYDEHALQVSDGYAADWPDYRHRTGMLKGMLLAIQICDEIDKQERS